MDSPRFQVAYDSYVAALLLLVRAYHGCEPIGLSEQQWRDALLRLLGPDSLCGRILLIFTSGKVVGDVALSLKTTESAICGDLV